MEGGGCSGVSQSEIEGGGVFEDVNFGCCGLDADGEMEVDVGVWGLAREAFGDGRTLSAEVALGRAVVCTRYRAPRRARIFLGAGG